MWFYRKNIETVLLYVSAFFFKNIKKTSEIAFNWKANWLSIVSPHIEYILVSRFPLLNRKLSIYIELFHQLKRRKHGVISSFAIETKLQQSTKNVKSLKMHYRILIDLIDFSAWPHIMHTLHGVKCISH